MGFALQPGRTAPSRACSVNSVACLTLPALRYQKQRILWHAVLIVHRASARQDRRITTGKYMNSTKMIGILLIAAGVLGLLYGGFSYTKETTAVKLGPIELNVQEKKTVNFPIWAGIGAIVAGGVLLVVGGKKG